MAPHRVAAGVVAGLRRLRPAALLSPLERSLGGLMRSRSLTSGTPYNAVTVGVPKETFPGEKRVAITPHSVASLIKAGVKAVYVESGAGAAAKFTDAGASRAGLRCAGALRAPSAATKLALYRPKPP